MEPAGVIALQPDDLHARDAFECVKHGTRAKALQRIRPPAALAHVHRVVIAVRVTEAQQQTARDVTSQRVDQFFLEQAHRRGAQDDDALVVQADHTQIRPEVQQLAELEAIDVHRLRHEVGAL
jgi:hypothetical protein